MPLYAIASAYFVLWIKPTKRLFFEISHDISDYDALSKGREREHGGGYQGGFIEFIELSLPDYKRALDFRSPGRAMEEGT